MNGFAALDIPAVFCFPVRSLLSYPRHHYFRRILCSYLGTLVENGEITQDLDLVGSVVKDVCYNNAIKYFNI